MCGLVNALGGVCDWQGRGSIDNELGVGENGELLHPAGRPEDALKASQGWVVRVAALVRQQLEEGKKYGRGAIMASGGVDAWIAVIAGALTGNPDPVALKPSQQALWRSRLTAIASESRSIYNEGGFLIRLVERLTRRIQRRWYVDTFGVQVQNNIPILPARIVLNENTVQSYRRPLIPTTLPQVPVPTVLPFHTFTYPLAPRDTRLISHRNALRISYSTLTQSWLPPCVYPPPRPPSPHLRIGYVSSDFNNHPLAHLMQSVFGIHDRTKYQIFCYATTPSDGSKYREKIERDAQHFSDVSQLTTQKIVEKIVNDEIHVLINLYVIVSISCDVFRYSCSIGTGIPKVRGMKSLLPDLRRSPCRSVDSILMRILA